MRLGESGFSPGPWPFPVCSSPLGSHRSSVWSSLNSCPCEPEKSGQDWPAPLSGKSSEKDFLQPAVCPRLQPRRGPRACAACRGSLSQLLVWSPRLFQIHRCLWVKELVYFCLFFLIEIWLVYMIFVSDVQYNFFFFLKQRTLPIWDAVSSAQEWDHLTLVGSQV